MSKDTAPHSDSPVATDANGKHITVQAQIDGDVPLVQLARALANCGLQMDSHGDGIRIHKGPLVLPAP